MIRQRQGKRGDYHSRHLRLEPKQVAVLRKGEPLTHDDGEVRTADAWYRVGEVLGVHRFGTDPLYVVVTATRKHEGRWAIDLVRAP